MIVDAIRTVVRGDALTREQAGRVMEQILTAQVSPAQFGAFVTALSLKGETADEIAGLSEVMRRNATPVDLGGLDVVDTCGTGGDASGWFNVSTTAAFVAAGAGAKVAKHGNRGISSSSGSADVLEALGIRLDIGPELVAQSVREAGVGFMFAQAFHPAMKFAAPLRREIGIRTVFNILGPLTNPAGAKRQLLGVADFALAPTIAEALGKTGSERVVVVNGAGGVDEITLAGATRVADFSNGATTTYEIDPGTFGLPQADPSEFAGGSPDQNAAITRSILDGSDTGSRRDLVVANAAGALLAAGLAAGWKEGVRKATESLDSGAARASLERMAEVTNRTSSE